MPPALRDDRQRRAAHLHGHVSDGKVAVDARPASQRCCPSGPRRAGGGDRVATVPALRTTAGSMVYGAGSFASSSASSSQAVPLRPSGTSAQFFGVTSRPSSSTIFTGWISRSTDADDRRTTTDRSRWPGAAAGSSRQLPPPGALTVTVATTLKRLLDRGAADGDRFRPIETFPQDPVVDTGASCPGRCRRDK